MNYLKRNFYRNKKKAQSATELAVFGAILIFVIGLILRSAMGASQSMNSQLRAMRFAMAESYRTSEGQYGGDDSMAARNTAAILLVEDRLSLDTTDKFGTRNRVPFVAAASATHSKNMFYPTDFDDNNVGVYDVIVNGQRFPFTTSGYRTYSLPTSSGAAAAMGILDCTVDHSDDTRCWDTTCLASESPPGCVRLHKVVGNYPSSAEWDASIGARFNLDFAGAEDVDPALRPEFYWQWVGVSAIAGQIDTETNTNTFLDVDGDYHEEGIFSISTDGVGRIESINVMDSQEGDLDFSYDDRDEALHGPQLIAIEGEDLQMFSFTQDGTALRIEEGKLFNPITDQFVRSTNRQDHVDIIQRAFHVSNDTERFCKGGSPRSWASPPYPGPVKGMTNPVEACGNCFSGPNIERTCMDTDVMIIFIRSRIRDLRGRRWVTRFY